MDPPVASKRSVLLGVACGVATAVLWASGFVAARHGIDIGFSPADLTFHRCFWAGLVVLPIAVQTAVQLGSDPRPDLEERLVGKGGCNQGKIQTRMVATKCDGRFGRLLRCVFDQR
mgnify:CR=1 FL=1